MKQIIIMCIILISVIGISIYVQKYLTATSNYLTDKLKNEKEKVENFDNTEQSKQEIQNLNNEIFNEWEYINSKWSIIVLHNELDLIQISLIKLKMQIQTENYKKALEEIETSIFLLEHIIEKEKLSLINIF